MLADNWYDVVPPPFVALAAVVVGAVLLWLARGKLATLTTELGLKGISAFGVDLQFAERQATVAYVNQGFDPPSEEDKAAIRDAARWLAPLVTQTRALWVDDNPMGNTVERDTLLSWKIDVQVVRTTDEALRELRESASVPQGSTGDGSSPSELGPYFDLVISDWRRPSEGDSETASAGIELLRRMRDEGREQSVIFYHGRLDDLDQLARRRRQALEAGAVGTTGSPGELFRWTLIELARVAFDRPNSVQLRNRERYTPAAVDRPD